MALATNCPNCNGSGKVHLEIALTATPSIVCPQCLGCGKVAVGDRFANGMSIDEYLQKRLGPDA